MTLAWMLYSVIVAALLGMAALAAERAGRLAGRPTRWIWVASLVGTVSLPFVARLGRAPGSPADGAVAPAGSELTGVAAIASAFERWWDAVAIPSSVEIPLVIGWVAASVLVLAALIGAYVRLRREIRRWRCQRIGDIDVRLSENRGPAVVGFTRIEVVLPRWVLACTATERHLILLHETEHRRAGDSRLLIAALAAAVLMPWNPIVWWQLRRLRVATEMDCDRRVLQKGADLRAYASLLLHAKLDGLGTRLLTATLFRSKSELGRRIESMTARQPSHRYIRAAAAVVIGGGILFAACETPTPAAPDVQASAAAEKTVPEDISFGIVHEAGELEAYVKQIHEVMKTDPEKAAELKAVLHDVQGNVFVTEDGDGHTFHLREMEAGAAARLKEVQEGKLTKEAFFRQSGEATWVSDEPAGSAKFGPTD